jgi:hypothetical protein
MKKKYLKPNVEYISLEVEDVITIIDGTMSGGGAWGDEDDC